MMKKVTLMLITLCAVCSYQQKISANYMSQAYAQPQPFIYTPAYGKAPGPLALTTKKGMKIRLWEKYWDGLLNHEQYEHALQKLDESTKQRDAREIAEAQQELAKLKRAAKVKIKTREILTEKPQKEIENQRRHETMAQEQQQAHQSTEYDCQYPRLVIEQPMLAIDQPRRDGMSVTSLASDNRKPNTLCVVQ